MRQHVPLKSCVRRDITVHAEQLGALKAAPWMGIDVAQACTYLPNVPDVDVGGNAQAQPHYDPVHAEANAEPAAIESQILSISGGTFEWDER